MPWERQDKSSKEHISLWCFPVTLHVTLFPYHSHQSLRHQQSPTVILTEDSLLFLSLLKNFPFWSLISPGTAFNLPLVLTIFPDQWYLSIFGYSYLITISSGKHGWPLVSEWTQWWGCLTTQLKSKIAFSLPLKRFLLCIWESGFVGHHSWITHLTTVA